MSRDRILATIRAATEGASRSSPRIETGPASDGGGIDRKTAPSTVTAAGLDHFRSQLKRHRAEILELGAVSELPAAVAPIARQQGATAIRSAMIEGLTPAAWTGAGVRIAHGRAEKDDLISISIADAGISATGVLVFASRANNPATLCYLPETHIAVLRLSDVAASMVDAIAIVRQRHGLPRTLGFIAGPSRTGDIGGRIVLGAHGPRRFIIALISESDVS